MTETKMTPQGVLKKNQVRSAEASAPAGPVAAAGAGGGKAQPQARIVEQHPTHAVVEVTCACGKKIYMNCEYAAASGAA